MAAAAHAFRWTYGDSFDFTLTWSPGGSPQDLTGYTVDMKVRNRATEVELLHLDTDTGGGLSIPTPANGQVVCAASPTVMLGGKLTNESKIHDFDLQVRSSDGSIIRTLIAGDFQVEKEVTDVA